MTTKENSVSIIVDDRERHSEVLKYLLNYNHAKVRTERLTSGEYLIDNHLLFERKTLKDFAVSIIDGRIFKQATMLANSHFKGVLIIEGTSNDLTGVGVSREAMQGALIMVSLILGVSILRSMNPSETASIMLYASRQITFFRSGILKRSGYKPKKKKTNKQLYILQSLPGVGLQRARILIEHFGSVEAVVTAGYHELMEVDGIGKNIAGKIRWVVSEQISRFAEFSDFPL